MATEKKETAHYGRNEDIAAMRYLSIRTSDGGDLICRTSSFAHAERVLCIVGTGAICYVHPDGYARGGWVVWIEGAPQWGPARHLYAVWLGHLREHRRMSASQ